ncbi:MAG: hypothetical protein ACOZD0_11475 [Pseudomonadota bacterium]
MLLFFSVARSQENGQWERAEVAQNDAPVKPVKTAKNATAPLTMNLPPMSSAFDTAMLLAAA